MNHNTKEALSDLAKNTFDEYMQRGDDFFKIELLRQAKNWYKKALDLNIENENVKSRISECERLLAFENRVTFILISIISAFLLAYLIFFNK